jgi:lipoprotein-releasing system permease protein
MHPSVFIAIKYFTNKAPTSLLYRMNLVACFSIGLSTMALILVLSIFNGLEELIKDLFRSFDPDLKIELKQGKYFQVDPNLSQHLSHIEGISKIVEVVEDNVLVTYQDKKLVAKLKGVSDNFIDQSPLNPFIVQGTLALSRGNQQLAIIGLGIQAMLSIQLQQAFSPLQVYYPKNIKADKPIPPQFYTKQFIKPGAVFAVEKKFDDNYIIVPLTFATKLMGLTTQRTSLELAITPGFSIQKIKKELQACLPGSLQVRDSDEQHVMLIRAMRIERLFVLLTLGFILLVASLNIFFMLLMLILEKRKDIGILYSLGATKKTIQWIFLLRGLFIGLSGTIIGMVIAWLLTELQERFGFITLGMQTGVIEAYPIKRHWNDFLFTTMGVVAMTFLAALRPAQLATRMHSK